MVKHNVLWFEVSMDDFLLNVDGIESRDELSGPIPQLLSAYVLSIVQNGL